MGGQRSRTLAAAAGVAVVAFTAGLVAGRAGHRAAAGGPLGPVVRPAEDPTAELARLRAELAVRGVELRREGDR